MQIPHVIQSYLLRVLLQIILSDLLYVCITVRLSGIVVGTEQLAT